MGIPRGSGRLLIEEAKARPFDGTLLQLGRSSVYFTERELRAWAARQGYVVPERATNDGDVLSHDPRLAAQGCIGDVRLFELLGFDRVESSDISEWEGADHIFDLNEPVSEELHGRFDAIFETGTIVQIFDLPQILENLHAMLRVGGRVIHCAVPSNNHMDLGFYMLSPSFFADFYAANGWRVECHYLCEYFAYWHDGRLYSDRWKIYDYTPGCLDALSYGRYGAAQAATFLTATKLEDSTGDVTPQLGHYQKTWQEFDQAGGADDVAAGLKQSDDPTRTAKGRVERRLSNSSLRGVTVAAKRVVEGVRRRLPRKMPPVRFRF